jgi:photosystem II stability/assembly factor-like uncharacterized protein
MVARSVRLALVLLALGPVAGARAAAIWTPLNSGTTQTITAISAPNASTVVYVTSGGQIHYLVSGTTFLQSTLTTPTGTPFTDVAMSPDGSKGVAVGTGGKIYNSTNSGHTWSPLAVTPSERSGACPTPGAPVSPLADDLFSVKFADNSTVFITGANDDVLKSVDGGAHFVEVNKGASSCVADPGGSTSAFTDSYWADASNGYLLSNDFGVLWSTTNGFTTATMKNGGANGFTYRDQLAVDSGDITRAWAVSAGNANGSFFQMTTDGGNNWDTPSFDRTQVALKDIAAFGSTVVAVGDGGDIYTSPDGRTFYRQIAAPPNATTNWRGVAVVNATTAYVAGEGGNLVESTSANQIPDTTAPTGSISGPAHLSPGQFGTFTATVTDNPGGSGIDPASFLWSTPGLPDQTGHNTASFAFNSTGTHTITVTFKDLAGNQGTASFNVSVQAGPPSGSSPTTTTTGGATITIFKRVTVKGRKGRFIPVVLKTSKPRKFVITLVTIAKKHKRSKTLARLTVTLKHGKRTIHLTISSKVKSGSYRLVVKVFTTGRHSHQTGRSVKQVFVLT